MSGNTWEPGDEIEFGPDADILIDSRNLNSIIYKHLQLLKVTIEQMEAREMPLVACMFAVKFDTGKVAASALGQTPDLVDMMDHIAARIEDGGGQ